MTLRRLFPLLVLVLACRAGAPQPPRTRSELVGVVWITPPQPYRVPGRIDALAVVGDEIFVGTVDGWLGAVDRRGVVVRERWIDARIGDLVKLRGGGLLALGTRGDDGVAFALDPHTLSTTPLAFPGDATRFAAVDTAVLADGGVVITGVELPLAVYDPVTLRERRVISADVGWTDPQVSGGHLFALRSVEHLDDLYRIELASGEVTRLPGAMRFAVGTDVIARCLNDEAIANASHAEIRVEARGATAFAVPGFSVKVAIDDDPSRLVTDIDGVVYVYDVPSGRLLHRVEAWAGGASTFVLALGGGRAVLASGSALRVLELATGSLSPLGGPDGAVTLAVDNAGRVSYLGTRAWQIVDGRVGEGAPIPGLLRLRPSPGVVDRYASADADSGRALAHAFPRGAELRSWDVNPTAWAYPGFFDGERIAVGVGTRGKPRLTVRGPGLASDLPLPSDGEVHDVDFATGRAVIVRRGVARVVRLDDGRDLHALAIPRCAELGRAALEPGGTRTATRDARTITVWDGATAVATTTFDEDITEVAFLATSGELVIATERHLALWSPGTGELRDVGVAVIHRLAVSPDGRKLALVFGDDRAALVDVAAFRAAVSVDRAPVAAATAACP